jgi:hypothetical protein
MGGEGMPQRVARRRFGNSRSEHGSTNRALNDGLMKEVAAALSRLLMEVVFGCWKDPLPRPFAPGVGVFVAQGMG